MNGWPGIWMNVRRNGRIYGSVDEWIYGWLVAGYMDGRMEVGGYMYVWKYEWVCGWMNA